MGTKTDIYISRLEWRAPKINPHIYSQLVFDKRGKNIQWKKISPASGVGKAGQLHVKINEVITHPLIILKNKLKMA